MSAGHARPNPGGSGHGVPQRAPACPTVVPDVPQQLPLLVPLSPPIGGTRGPRRGTSTEHLTANTCPKCKSAILAGTSYGMCLNLEPRTLDDHTEYLALADNVRTYNLLPDRTAQRRHVEHIKRPSTNPRHAEHTCGRQYGHLPAPAPPAQPVDHDDPPF